MLSHPGFPFDVFSSMTLIEHHIQHARFPQPSTPPSSESESTPPSPSYIHAPMRENYGYLPFQPVTVLVINPSWPGASPRSTPRLTSKTR